MNEQDISLRKLKFANHHKRLAITPRAMEDKVRVRLLIEVTPPQLE